ncbi:MAG TPA: protease pro-enzyme activation domain-containing protein, partial [Nitrososphaerales archaeon]|nr:protease pro-enzyme activation domain-containing protein [Nitrososphaerales archaeon]
MSYFAILILVLLLSSSAAVPFVPGLSRGTVRTEVGAPTPMSLGASLGSAPSTLTVAASVGFFNSSQSALLGGFLQALYDPSSYMYHQFLTSEQYTNLFAPSPSTYQAAVSYFQSYGLTTFTDSSRLFLNLVGTLSQYQQAFGTSFGLFSGTHYKFYANTAALFLPSSFSSYVTSVVGLENYTYYVPYLVKVPGTSS